jgi:hypothetical protein
VSRVKIAKIARWTSALLFSSVICSGVASAGTVNAVQASARSIAVGAALSVTVTGTNPCGAAHINYGDGTAITYAITGLPTTQTHAFQQPGTYSIVARGMGNCDGEATTRVDVTGPPPPPPPPPSASEITGVTFMPTPGVIRQPVAINVAGRGTCAFTVNFGDGNQQDFSGSLPQRVNHTFAVAKTYTVIVAPAAPCAGKFTERLQVATRGGERITNLTIDPMLADVGRGVTIVVDGVGTCAYRIEFGDGNRDERTKPLPDRLHHVYNAPGSYIVAVAGTGTCEGRTQRTLDVR